MCSQSVCHSPARAGVRPAHLPVPGRAVGHTDAAAGVSGLDHHQPDVDGVDCLNAGCGLAHLPIRARLSQAEGFQQEAARLVEGLAV